MANSRPLAPRTAVDEFNRSTTHKRFDPNNTIYVGNRYWERIADHERHEHGYPKYRFFHTYDLQSEECDFVVDNAAAELLLDYIFENREILNVNLTDDVLIGRRH
jgi:hypothetical protein